MPNKLQLLDIINLRTIVLYNITSRYIIIYNANTTYIQNNMMMYLYNFLSLRLKGNIIL